MTKSRRNSLAPALALALLAAGASAGEDFAAALGRLGLVYGGAVPFRVERSSVRGDWKKGPRESYWTLTASSEEGASLRLNAARNIRTSAARKRAAEKFQTVENLYAGTAFYPGMITQTFEAPEELKPRILEPGPAGERTLLLYANDALAYGAGSEDVALYRGALTFRYCKDSKTLVQVEYFLPKERYREEDFLKELAAISCR